MRMHKKITRKLDDGTVLVTHTFKCVGRPGQIYVSVDKTLMDQDHVLRTMFAEKLREARRKAK